MDPTENILKDHIEATFADMDKIQKEISDSDKLFELKFGGEANVVRALLKNVFKFLTPMQMLDFAKGKIYQYDVYGEQYVVVDCENLKVAVSEDYNFIFNKTNGRFMRWGKTYEDDPDYSPIGGEILDIEITTICKGIRGHVCNFCYKSNTPNGKNMSFDTFRVILDKMGAQLGQVAFGADSMATSNPDLWKMMEYCRGKGIVPNLTVADVSDEVADNLAKYCGAVAVSRYDIEDICYDSIKKLTDRGMKQVNMHFMICEETYEQCLKTLKDIKTDDRLAKMNAIVLLSLKRKGRGVTFTPLSGDKYNNLVKYCLDNNISFGMDSCGAKKFLDAVKDHPDYEKFKVVAEPCESTNFSQYIDVEGKFYPCSFCEGVEGWEDGIDVAKIKDFLKDVWYNIRVRAFRNKLNKNCDNCHKARECPIYQV